MSDFMRSIPITPDMVSLWVPSGLNRAQDLIRGNHGQCFGTHPNVPVISTFQPPNLLTDGGLNEWSSATNLAYWSEAISGGSVLNREATEKVEGDYSCRFDVDASNSSVYISQGFSLVPSKKHEVIIWYKNSIVGKTSQFLFYDNAANVYLKSDGTWAAIPTVVLLPNSTVWKKSKLPFSAHADYSTYILRLNRASSASSSIYFDKVSIEELKPSLINPSVGWVFGGDDYITIPEMTISKDSGAVTLWVYTIKDFTGQYGDSGYIVGLSSFRTKGYLGLRGDGVGGYNLYGETDLNEEYFVNATNVVPRGQWNCIEASFDSGVATTYVNAVQVDENPGLTNDWIFDTIGMPHAHVPFTGNTALLSVSRKPRSQAQVNNFYNATKGLFAPRG